MCDDGTCFRSFAKVILIIVNIIFFLAGLLMLGFGIALVVAPEKVISFLSSNVNFAQISDSTGGFFVEIIKASGIFMIILGAVVAIIAFFGFFGACCESKCMIVTYAIILIIIVLAEVALIIFAAQYPNVFEKVGEQTLNETLYKEFNRDVMVDKSGTIMAGGEGLKVETAWNAFQVKFNCCGSSNFTDYGNFNWTPTNNCSAPIVCNSDSKLKVPLSCCKLNTPNVTPTNLTDFTNPGECQKTASSSFTHIEGCSKKIIVTVKDYIMQYSKIAIGIAAGIVGLEIILITLAFIICCCGEGSSNKYV
jgi:hypothetical protein